PRRRTRSRRRGRRGSRFLRGSRPAVAARSGRSTGVVERSSECARLRLITGPADGLNQRILAGVLRVMLHHDAAGGEVHLGVVDAVEALRLALNLGDAGGAGQVLGAQGGLLKRGAHRYSLLLELAITASLPGSRISGRMRTMNDSDQLTAAD